MKALVYINRHVVTANKKSSNGTAVVDNPAIVVRTYQGTIYCKEIEFTSGCKLIQNAKDARCSGATIWLECEFESLLIDGKKAHKSMFEKV